MTEIYKQLDMIFSNSIGFFIRPKSFSTIYICSCLLHQFQIFLAIFFLQGHTIQYILDFFCQP